MPLKKYRESFIYFHSDCTIISDKLEAIETGKKKLKKDFQIVNQFVNTHPEWKDSMVPIQIDGAPQVCKEMENIASRCEVGPMAAIAGVIADRMKDEIKEKHDCQIIVVENGGEIAIDSCENIIIGLDVMTTVLKSKIGFNFKGDSKPLGVGTSSGQFGHAFSYGEADAVTIFADSAGLADAAATKICNFVKGDDYNRAIEENLKLIDDIEGVNGIIIARGGLVGTNGIIPSIIRIKNDNK